MKKEHGLLDNIAPESYQFKVGSRVEVGSAVGTIGAIDYDANGNTIYQVRLGGKWQGTFKDSSAASDFIDDIAAEWERLGVERDREEPAANAVRFVVADNQAEKLVIMRLQKEYPQAKFEKVGEQILGFRDGNLKEAEEGPVKRETEYSNIKGRVIEQFAISEDEGEGPWIFEPGKLVSIDVANDGTIEGLWLGKGSGWYLPTLDSEERAQELTKKIKVIKPKSASVSQPSHYREVPRGKTIRPSEGKELKQGFPWEDFGATGRKQLGASKREAGSTKDNKWMITPRYDSPYGEKGTSLGVYDSYEEAEADDKQYSGNFTEIREVFKDQSGDWQFVDSFFNRGGGMKREAATQYLEIVFMQGDDAQEALKVLEDEGEQGALEYLRQWETGDEQPTDKIPWGESDDLYSDGEYVLTYNTGLGYIGLTKQIESKGGSKKQAAEEDKTVTLHFVAIVDEGSEEAAKRLIDNIEKYFQKEYGSIDFGANVNWSPGAAGNLADTSFGIDMPESQARALIGWAEGLTGDEDEIYSLNDAANSMDIWEGVEEGEGEDQLHYDIYVWPADRSELENTDEPVEGSKKQAGKEEFNENIDDPKIWKIVEDIASRSRNFDEALEKIDNDPYIKEKGMKFYASDILQELASEIWGESDEEYMGGAFEESKYGPRTGSMKKQAYEEVTPESFAGNWKKWSDFGWSAEPKDGDNWGIFYTSNRDSGLLEQSNAAAIDEIMGQFDEYDEETGEGDVQSESHGHWADGWAVRVYDKEGEVTPAFNALQEITKKLSDYPLLDEDDYSRRELEATWENAKQFVKDGVNAGDFDIEVTDELIGAVVEWLNENDPGALESSDDRGGWASEDQVIKALEGLGYEPSVESQTSQGGENTLKLRAEDFAGRTLKDSELNAIFQWIHDNNEEQFYNLNNALPVDESVIQQAVDALNLNWDKQGSKRVAAIFNPTPMPDEDFYSLVKEIGGNAKSDGRIELPDDQALNLRLRRIKAEYPKIQLEKAGSMERKAEEGYQGWTNHSTWAVALWLDNDAGTQELMREYTQNFLEAHKGEEKREGVYSDAVVELAGQIKSFIEDGVPELDNSVYSDLLNGALEDVEYRVIAENYLENYEQQ